MNENILETILEQNPDLTYIGMGMGDSPRGISAEEQHKQFNDARVRLLRQKDSFKVACEWLGNKKKRKHINRKHGSYTLKHIAEDETGCYFSNGIFIAAALHCGFMIQKIPEYNNPNVYFNIQNVRRPIKYQR